MKGFTNDTHSIYDSITLDSVVHRCNCGAMMHNKHIEFMKKEIEDGKVIDVSVIGRQVKPGLYYLGKYLDGGYDYFDTKTGTFIYSIGIDIEGNIWASSDTLFYMNPDYECIWLR